MNKIFLNTIQKFSPENSLPLLRNRVKTESILLTCDVNYPVSMSLFCLSQSFVYLIDFVQAGTEARTEVKYINKNVAS